MTDASQAKAEGKWEVSSHERNCYCGGWDKDPAAYEKEGYALGYCGICERCAAPGHTRHFPGPVAYTGAWCDKCYRVLKWTWPFRSVAGWLYLLAVVAIGSVFVRPLIDVVKRALG